MDPLYTYDPPLVTGTLIKRYKRFLADIQLDDGRLITAHVPNTGSMSSTRTPGSPVAVSPQNAPHRKLKWTLELVRSGDAWVQVNTSLTNELVARAITAGKVGSLRGYPTLRREVPYHERSRVDILLKGGKKPAAYVEVKNVTYREGHLALFPDAVTARGAKHLMALAQMVKQGHRGIIFFAVNRGDCNAMSPAAHIDPQYAELLATVINQGVEATVYRFEHQPGAVTFGGKLKLVLP